MTPHAKIQNDCPSVEPALVAQWSTHSGTMISWACFATGAGSTLSLGVTAFQQRIISSNSYAHDEHWDNPGQEKGFTGVL